MLQTTLKIVPVDNVGGSSEEVEGLDAKLGRPEDSPTKYGEDQAMEQRVSDFDVAAAAFDTRPPTDDGETATAIMQVQAVLDNTQRPNVGEPRGEVLGASGPRVNLFTRGRGQALASSSPAIMGGEGFGGGFGGGCLGGATAFRTCTGQGGLDTVGRSSSSEPVSEQEGIKAVAAPSSAASTPYSSVAQPPAPPAASTLRGDDQAQDAKAGDRLALNCRYKLEGQPVKALKKIVTDAGYDLTASMEKGELLDIAVAVRLKHCPIGVSRNTSGGFGGSGLGGGKGGGGFGGGKGGGGFEGGKGGGRFGGGMAGGGSGGGSGGGGVGSPPPPCS